jgi:hypothetical protein
MLRHSSLENSGCSTEFTRRTRLSGCGTVQASATASRESEVIRIRGCSHISSLVACAQTPPPTRVRLPPVPPRLCRLLTLTAAVSIERMIPPWQECK